MIYRVGIKRANLADDRNDKKPGVVVLQLPPLLFLPILTLATPDPG